MAVVNTKSAAITGADVPQRPQTSTAVGPRRVYGDVGVVAVANGDSIASVLRAVRVPSSAGIRSVVLKCTAITSGAADVGVYQTAANGGAVVDADLFGSAVSIASALAGTDVTHESGVFTIDKVEKQLWELLGLTADPKVDYDIALTLTAAAAAAGTVALSVEYTAAN
jgi:hypothetical protein